MRSTRAGGRWRYITAALLLTLAAPGHAVLDEVLDWFRSGSGATTAAALSQSEIAAGLKEALSRGAQSAVASLGRPDGFLANVDVRIPVPEHLSLVERGLRTVGKDDIADEFVATLNHAAERAVPEAATVFVDAISRMSIDDATAVLKGGDTAATDYLRRSSSDTLTTRFTPIVEEAMQQAGVTRAYQNLIGSGGFMGSFMKDSKWDLTSYVTERALDGVFLMVGREEQRIRANPAARTTELLKKVFAAP